MSRGMDVEESRVHRVCQPNVMIGFSEGHAGFNGKWRINGEYGPGRLVGQKLNDPIVVVGKMREGAAHSEDALLKDVWDVVGRGAVKQKGGRPSNGRRIHTFDTVAVGREWLEPLAAVLLTDVKWKW